MKTPSIPYSDSGLTLLEVLVVVAVIAIAGSGAVVVTGNIQERVRSEKLELDVGTINRAIGLYEGHGGTMQGINPHPWYILGQLKSKVAEENVDEVVGLTGRFIDPRLQPLFMSAEAIAGDRPRAVWDPAKRRFVVIADDSIVGPKIKEFKLTDDTPEEEAFTQAALSGIDARDLHAFGYAKDGTWVWEYEDAASTSAPAPTAVTLNLPATPTPPGAPAGTTALDPPLFSIPGGRYALSSYDLSLTLANPNDPAVSEVHYSTHLGSWNLYTGTPIVVQAGMQVSAMAASTDPANWTNSEVAREGYETAAIAMEIALEVPESMSYEEAGGAMEGVSPGTVGPGMASLLNAAEIPLAYQNSQRIQVMWTYDGTDPVSLAALEHVPGTSWPPPNLHLGDPFGNGFPGQWVDLSLGLWGAQDSLPIQVVAKSTNPEILLSSSVVLETVAIRKVLIPPPSMSAAGKTVTITKQPGLGNLPVGARIFYTTDGTFPGSSNGEPTAGTLYTGPFNIDTTAHPHCGNFMVIAKVYGPAGHGHWFVPSASATQLIEVPPDPGTPERFAYNFSKSGLAHYGLFVLKKIDAKDETKLFGNLGIGPEGNLQISPMGVSGGFDVDPGASVSNQNVYQVPGGTPVTANPKDLSQEAADLVTLSAEASLLSPTQSFAKIDDRKTIYPTTGFNVIRIGELKLTNVRKLTLVGEPNTWYVVNVTSKLEIDDGGITAEGGMPVSHVLVNYTGTIDAKIQGDGSVGGTLLAPEARVQILNEINLEGSIFVEELQFHKDAVIHADTNGFAFECTAEGEAVGGATDLEPPVFSIPGRTYPSNDFALSLELSDPNGPGSARTFYSVNGGSFTEYAGPIAVPANARVEAFAQSLDVGRWNDSVVVDNTYAAGLPQLEEPVIAMTAAKFDAGANENVTVTITNPNVPALGTLRYRLLDRGGWAVYGGPFVLNAYDYVTLDAIIEAQVIAANPTAYADSDSVTDEVLMLPQSPLDKPEVTLTTGTTTDPDGTTVTIGDPNPGGTSLIYFILVPVPSTLGCDIIHGGGYPVGTFIPYSGPIEIDSATYPDGFAVITYAQAQNGAWIDSVFTLAYDESDVTGLRGGHFDVDTTGSSRYSQVWANWPGGGSTDKHTHEFDNKFDTVVVDLMQMNDGHLGVPQRLGASDNFKIIVVNANLSPGAHLVINQQPNYSAPYATAYDDTSFADLPIYSLDGHAGTTKLSKLSVFFDEDAIVNAGLLPSNTGDVKGNTPGKAGEWRNGALTVQVVKVDAAGNLPGGPLDAAKSNGGHGVGDNLAVKFEATVFWHWPGDSYHKATNPYVPGEQYTIVGGLDESEEPVCAN